MPERTCSVEDCTRPHRARGLCSTHYNRTHIPPEVRHRKATIPCDWCGKPCQKDPGRRKRYAGLFCGMSCRDAWRLATGNNPFPSEEARCKGRAVLDSRRRRAQAKMRKAARGTRGRHWTAGQCERCGASFVSEAKSNHLGRYCSNACKRRAKASRRRARQAGAQAERYSRVRIFERDKWRCHICKRKTKRTVVVPHPRAPVVDHLIPLAHGGDDTAANVATACFMCNSVKSDRGSGEQLALIG